MITTREGGTETVDQNEKFLGYLATIVESWKVVLIIPLLVGALTYVYLTARPSLYRSDAVLRLNKNDVVVLKSGRVFGEAVKKIAATDSANGPAPASIVVTSASASVATADLDSQDDYSVAVTYKSAAGAAAILQEAINRLPGETTSSTFDRARLEERIKLLSEAQDNIVKSIEKLNALYDRAAKSEPGPDSSSNGYYGLSFASLMYVLAQNNEDLGKASDGLQSTFGPEDIIQPPSVPTGAITRTISPFVMLTVVLSFAGLLVFVFAREALRNTKDSPNMTRIRRALRLSAKP